MIVKLITVEQCMLSIIVMLHLTKGNRATVGGAFHSTNFIQLYIGGNLLLTFNRNSARTGGAIHSDSSLVWSPHTKRDIEVRTGAEAICQIYINWRFFTFQCYWNVYQSKYP